MNLPAFKFIDGKLVELPEREFRPTLIEFVPRPTKPKLVSRKLTPWMRRRIARKGRPRRQAKRVDAWSTEWEFPRLSHRDEIVWERHTIAIGEEAPDPLRFWLTTIQPKPICFVYLPQGKKPNDEVLHAVEWWHFDRMEHRT